MCVIHSNESPDEARCAPDNFFSQEVPPNKRAGSEHCLHFLGCIMYQMHVQSNYHGQMHVHYILHSFLTGCTCVLLRAAWSSQVGPTRWPLHRVTALESKKNSTIMILYKYKTKNYICRSMCWKSNQSSQVILLVYVELAIVLFILHGLIYILLSPGHL